ncbi:MAG: hypothetical protein IJS46_04570 [Kiritimatiellae bacterium]|nr:hypothetical protein [Kiritimatiellia bacterium]
MSGGGGTVCCGPASGDAPGEPAVDESFSILFDSPRFAIVEKSGNMPCHASGRYVRNTLERVLLEKAGFPAVFFASRLDRETSGAVVVAKDAETAGALGRAMMRREFSKSYLCLARGRAPDGFGTDVWREVSGDLYPATDGQVYKFRVFVPDDPAAAALAGPDPSVAFTGASQRATTRLRIVPWESLGVEPDAAAGFVALEAEPVTGRTHQIRATVRALGLQVVGDKLYGPSRAIYARMCAGEMTAADAAALALPRQALHSWRIALKNPETGERVGAVSDPAPLVAAFSTALQTRSKPEISGAIAAKAVFG